MPELYKVTKNVLDVFDLLEKKVSSKFDIPLVLTVTRITIQKRVSSCTMLWRENKGVLDAKKCVSSCRKSPWFAKFFSRKCLSRE